MAKLSQVGGVSMSKINNDKRTKTCVSSQIGFAQLKTMVTITRLMQRALAARPTMNPVKSITPAINSNHALCSTRG